MHAPSYNGNSCFNILGIFLGLRILRCVDDKDQIQIMLVMKENWEHPYWIRKIYYFVYTWCTNSDSFDYWTIYDALWYWTIEWIARSTHIVRRWETHIKLYICFLFVIFLFYFTSFSESPEKLQKKQFHIE